MALTRITKGVIKPNENYDTHNIVSTGIVTAIGLDINGNGDVSGDLNVGGVLTYEDVTSIDSVGLITARNGIDCNGDLDVDGHTNLDNVSIAGITTVSTGININPSTSNLYQIDGALSYYATNNGVYLNGAGASGWLRLQAAGSSNDRTSINLKGHSMSGGDTISFKTNSTERLKIASNGSITASGTFSPTANNTYDLGGSSNVWKKIYGFDLDIDGHTNLDNVSIAGITTFTNGYFDLKPNGGGNAHFRILSTGTGDAGIFFDAANGDISGSDYVFIGQKNNLDFVINANVNAGNIDFQRAGNTQLRINSDGDVIIGSGGAWSYPKPLNVQGSSGSILSLYNGDTGTYAANTFSGIEFKLRTGNTGNTYGTCEIRAFKENGTNGNNASGLSFYTRNHGGSSTERLRIESSGRLLLGTTSSRETRAGGSGYHGQLQMESNNEAALTMTRFGGTHPSRLNLQHARGTIASIAAAQDDDDLGQISFSGWDGDTFTNAAEIRAEVDGTPGDDDMPGRLIFSTTPDNSINAQERLRITSSGTVGVNCTPTALPLEVKQQSADGGALRLRDSSAQYRYLEFDVTGATSTITARSNNSHGNINIGTLSQFGRETAIYINGGNPPKVGINTDNPQERLHIHEGDIVIGQESGSTTNIRNYIKFGRVDAPKAAIGFINTTGNGRGDILFMNSDVSNTSEFTDTDEVVRITHEGKFGIGTNNPTELIDVYKTSNDAVIKTRTTAAGAYFDADSVSSGFYGLRLKSSGTDKWFLGSYNSANFQIKDGSGFNGTEVFTIEDGTGNVGIGTDDPDVKLEIGTVTGAYMNEGGIQVNRPHSLGLKNGIHVYTDAGYNPTSSYRTAAFKATGSSGHAFACSTDAGSNGLGGTNNARIDFDGDAHFLGGFGVGTASPSDGAKMEVFARGDTERGIYITDSDNTHNSPYLRVLGKRNDGNTHQSFSGRILLASLRTDAKVNSGRKVGVIMFGGNHTNTSESNILYPASIAAVAGGSYDSATDMPTDLVFYTGSTGRAPNTNNVSSGDERLRIQSGGNVEMAQDVRLVSLPNSGNGAGLKIGGNGQATDNTYGSMAVTNGNLHLDSRNGTYGVYLNWYGGAQGTYFGNGSSGQRGRIDGSGNLSLSGSYPGSDLRLKENIQNISGATDTIKSLVGKTFTWKTEAGLDDWKHYGFIAQEVQKVAPDLVKSIGCHYFDKDDKLVTDIDPTESDEDRKNKGITQSLTVNNEGVTPILVEAMKELIAKVETLEAEVATLKGS